MIELLSRHIVVLALAALLAIVLRRHSAALRHALWTISLVVCILLPILQRIPIPVPMRVAQSLELESVSSGPALNRVAPEPGTSAVAPDASLDRWRPYLWSAYLAVAAALVFRWGIGWLLVSRLARAGRVCSEVDGIPIVVVDRIGPLTFGWRGAVILVPHMKFDLHSPVIRHELAHIRRADFVWQGLSALACALWWFSPLVWFAARMMRREAERACDDTVLKTGVLAPDYAQCLVEIASMKSRSLPLADSFVHAIPEMRRSDLASRIASVLTNCRDRGTAKPLAVFALVAILLPSGVYISRPVLAADTEALRGKKIVLDPGHGGRDPGGKIGDQKESDINLAIAQRVADLLRKEGAEVTLTRHDDTSLDLKRRAAYSAGQNLFLSIHVDLDRTASTESRPFPVKVYFHGTVDSPHYLGATRIAQTLVSVANAPPNAALQGQVYAAKYAVLRDAESPAYLISFGKMNNDNDLATLHDSAFLDRLSRSVVEGARAILK